MNCIIQRKIFKSFAAILVLLAFLFSLPSCQSNSASKQILGAGSTFGFPIYSKMFYEYNRLTGVQANYQSIGSGGGIKQLFANTVDFGASDAFVSDKKAGDAGAPIVQFPTCLGAVVLSYNLPGNPKINLSPEVIGGIFMGKVHKWDDPLIKRDNPGLQMPALDISVVHRSDGSGTSYIFTDYLSKIYPGWRKKVGAATSVNWPVGIAGKGNEGVAAQIQQVDGAIGYVELIFADKNNMTYAAVKNSSGQFILPTLKSIEEASDIELPADSRITITNSGAPGAYPISSFTWILIYKEQHYDDRSYEKAKYLVEMMWWVIHDAQAFCEPLLYASLSPHATSVAENILRSVTYDGKPILNAR
jgi:phosphate transport system substrate-binding protein